MNSGPVESTRTPKLLSWEPDVSVLIFGNGNFQRLALFCAQLSLFVSILHGLAHYVFTKNVNHWCKPPEEYAHLSVVEWKNISVPKDGDDVLGSCTRYEPPLSIPSENRTEVPCDGWDYDAETSGTTITTEYDLVCERRWLVSLLLITYYAGSAITLPLAGFAADRFGRRPVLIVSLMIQMGSLLASCFFRSLEMFAVLRCQISIAVSAFEVIIIVVLFEVTSQSHRVLFVTLAIAVPLVLAPITTFVLGTLVAHWVLIQGLLMLPAALLAVALYPIAESPRWLMVTWRFKEAEQAILWASKINGVTDFSEVRAAFCRVKENVVSQLGFSATPSVFDIACSKSIRTRSAIVFGCWLVQFNAYFNIIAPQVRLINVTVQAVILILSLPVMVLNYYSMKTCGRRRTLSLNFLLVSVLALAQGVLIYVDSPRELGIVNVAAMLTLNALFVTMFVYTVEIYPTALRCMALSAAFICGRIGRMTASMINNAFKFGPLVNQVIPIVVSGTGLFIFSLLVTLLPETLPSPLTDTTQPAVLEEKWQTKSPPQPKPKGRNKTKKQKVLSAEWP
ncbi:solute carrier family 22 member 4-like [Ixodes scapularis]|uniref:solute carrier family 22 member 4-like n=1 Tax=Ixodes scapularis TaxID=6945 RepID=UPI001A9F6C66|nr:solute carrier family 22 member 4-like [Ixodes scapularis]